MVSCQKGPTRHAYAWQIGGQDTLELYASLALNDLNYLDAGRMGINDHIAFKFDRCLSSTAAERSVKF